MRRAAALFLVVGLASLAWAAPRVDPPHRILFLGNSFTYFNDGVGTHLQKLAIAADPLHAAEYGNRMVTVGGAALYQLEDKLAGPLKSERFDVVVLQGQSAEPMADRDAAARFRSAARSLDKAIRGAGARTVLYMTWAYRDHPDMTEPLAQAYIAAGDELGALVVPVGLAFARARGTVNLYDPDGHHPSLAGTYLAACVFYASLYGKSPEGLSYLAGLPETVARGLQKTAWETVSSR